MGFLLILKMSKPEVLTQLYKFQDAPFTFIKNVTVSSSLKK